MGNPSPALQGPASPGIHQPSTFLGEAPWLWWLCSCSEDLSRVLCDPLAPVVAWREQELSAAGHNPSHRLLSHAFPRFLLLGLLGFEVTTVFLAREVAGWLLIASARSHSAKPREIQGQERRKDSKEPRQTVKNQQR